MAATIKYKGSTIATVDTNATKVLKVGGKYCEGDITVENMRDSGKEVIEWHQCPEVVRNYLANITYDPSDYSESQIETYLTNIPADSKPVGKTVDGVTYYNEIPNKETPFSSENKAGTVKPLDALRWLNTTTPNVRDLGGWACDGGKVKYGMLFRGGEPNATDKNLMVDKVGIKYELNLRGNEVPQRDYSVWEIEYSQPSTYAWYTISNKPLWNEILKTIIYQITHEQPLYFHCMAGADRTGTVACIIEAILGVSQSDVDKDYEITTFSTGTSDIKARNSSNWKQLINAIKAIPLPSGVEDTFRNHAIYFAASCGITEDEINAFRSAMIDGTPETITLLLNSYTITKNATNIAFDNDDSTKVENQSYELNLTAKPGYVFKIDSITMGGSNVLPYFTGTFANLNYNVSLTLNHCTTDNSKTYVIDGSGFLINLTADEGYSLEGATVTITMGGVDVSTYYSNGKIAIPNVTGDIIITATAVASAPAYTNQIPISTDTDGSIYNGTGYKNRARINSSGAVVDYSNHEWSATGFIPCKGGDIIRFAGIYVQGNNGDCHITPYNSAKQKIATGDFTAYLLSNGEIESIKPYNWNSTEQRLYSFTVPRDADIAYYRFSLYGDGANAIVTVNEEIV